MEEQLNMTFSSSSPSVPNFHQFGNWMHYSLSCSFVWLESTGGLSFQCTYPQTGPHSIEKTIFDLYRAKIPRQVSQQ